MRLGDDCAPADAEVEDAPQLVLLDVPGEPAEDRRALPRVPVDLGVEAGRDDALAAGVETTGVTVHYVDEGLDTGDVIRQEEISVEPRETLVERERLIDGSRIDAGDAIVGFPSAGVHANGFTLVRRILEEEPYDGPDLLAPTRLYAPELRDLGEGAEIRGLAHVTGGGIVGNLTRILPDGLRAEIDWEAWERPPVFEWLARHVDEEELRRVFNLGIGYCAVVPEAAGDRVIGEVVPR